MLAKTHFILGMLAGLLAINLFVFDSIAKYAVYFIMINSGVVFPDFDHPKSLINSKLRITKIFSVLFKHRGILHSIFALVIISALLYFYAGLFFAAAFFLGYLSHLFSDALTADGINFLAPISKFKVSGPIKTGGTSEKIVLYLAVLLIILRIYLLIK